MYKVVSTILALPYGTAGYTFQGGGNNQEHYIEWFKRDEQTGTLIGMDQNEALDLKNYLDVKCRHIFSKNEVTVTSESEIPHESEYAIPDNTLPIYYPFEDLGVENPFEFELMGYNRFIAVAR